MACAMIKPTGSHSYLESAVARGQQAYYLKITSRSVMELEEKPAATQIQQRHEFSSWRLAMQTSSSPRKFSTRSKIFCTESFTMEIRKDSSRVQGRLHARTTTEFLTPFRNSQSEKQHFFATKCCGKSSRFLAKVLRKLRCSPGVLLPDFSPCTVTIQRVRDLERIRAIDLLPDFVQIAGFVLRDFTPDSYTRFYQISDFEFYVVMNSACTDFCYRNMGLRNILDSGLLCVTTWPRPLRGVKIRD
ncbi:hypothetical protein F511_23021 [Dorcoceras hygrometricum]|uniref:Uncharacterized protein n=1 Tax=Dorcoceras hygrometricum TaxID=472368 RepID=A0A2Z7ALK1_9LAMI|nr:hypothetical protein F511_23021 [Dorcoceras hygrometricum]